jgi:hypothetical protein
MIKKIICAVVCVTMLGSAALVMAGGPPLPGVAPCGPTGARGYVPPGNPCAFWGDAPFPGLCGGVVALPFLVVGSLLGGNTTGPYGPGLRPGYKGVAAPYPPVKYAAPAAPGCGPGYYGAAYGGAGANNGLFGGIPCLELCSGIFGSVTNGMGLSMY